MSFRSQKENEFFGSVQVWRLKLAAPLFQFLKGKTDNKNTFFHFEGFSSYSIVSALDFFAIATFVQTNIVYPIFVSPI
jgi:hypothetical protein